MRISDAVLIKTSELKQLFEELGLEPCAGGSTFQQVKQTPQNLVSPISCPIFSDLLYEYRSWHEEKYREVD